MSIMCPHVLTPKLLSGFRLKVALKCTIKVVR